MAVLDRLVAFIERRAASVDARAEVTNAVLLEGDRAQADVTFNYSDSAGQSAHVRFYEAHWADAFHAPRATAVLRWIAWIFPLTMITRGIEIVVDAVARWGSHPLHWWRIASSMFIVLLGFPVALAAAFVIALAAVLRRLVPVTSIRNALARVELTLSQVLGDSFLYTMSPTNASAAVSPVEKTIEAAANECGEVVVLAHSQGAQVAADALARSEKGAATFITYGAGIGQLEWLQRMTRERRFEFVFGALAWLFSIAAIAWLVLLVYGLQHAEFEDAAVAFGMFAGWWAVPAAIVGAIRYMAKHSRARVLADADRKTIGGVATWIDLSATADLVSGRPVVELVYTGVEGKTIVNGRNFLTDHTSYLKNQDEVLPAIAGSALRPWTPLAELCRVNDAAVAIRHVATRWLVGSRILALALIVAAMAGLDGIWESTAEDTWRVVTEPLGWVGLNPSGVNEVAGVRVDKIALAVTILALATLPHWLNLGVIRIWRANVLPDRSARNRESTAFALWLTAVYAVMLAISVTLVEQSTPIGLEHAADAIAVALAAVLLAAGLAAVVRRALPKRARAALTPDPLVGLAGGIWTWAGVTIVLLAQGGPSKDPSFVQVLLLSPIVALAIAAAHPIGRALKPLIIRSLELEQEQAGDPGPRLALLGTAVLIMAQVGVVLVWNDLHGLLQVTVAGFSMIFIWGLPILLWDLRATHPRGVVTLATASSMGFAAILIRAFGLY